MGHSPKLGRRSALAWLAWMVTGCTIETRGLDTTDMREDTAVASDSGQDAGRAPSSPRDASKPAPNDDDKEDRDEPSDERELDAEVVVDAAVDSAFEAGSDAPDADTVCPLEGVRALRVDAHVTWEGNALLEIIPVVLAGSGVVQIIVLAETKPAPDGSGDQITIRACGATVPPFLSVFNEVYAVTFPDQVWELIESRWTTSFSRSCAQPGCAVSTGRVVPQLGIELPDDAPWPGPFDNIPLSSERDDDGDGIPGILLHAHAPAAAGGGLSYAYPPVDFLTIDRTKDLMLALRVAMQLDGTMESCTRASGTASGATIDTRALACRLVNGAMCRQEQESFLDEHLPVWAVERTDWEMVDLAPGAGCAEARAAFR